jgi:hypothetical protein
MIFSVLAFVPMLTLMFKGRQWRDRLGTPRNGNASDVDYERKGVDTLGEERKEEEIGPKTEGSRTQGL